MGGPGSGNRWRYDAKSTTDDYRTLDVRRWVREGVLRPGYWGGWQWTRDGETVASIQMRAEQDRVILIYRHRSGDGEWKDEHYMTCASCARHATSAVRALGSSARRSVAGGAWRSSTAAPSSPVAAAIGSPTPVHARMQVDVPQGGLTGFGHGWAGSRAF
jgi:hypothetical protein